jgi:hypothetical protein
LRALRKKRFSRFKTDFAVAPVHLKNVARIQGLLAAYFFALASPAARGALAGGANVSASG